MKVTVRYSAKVDKSQGNPVELASSDALNGETMRISIPMAAQERINFDSAPRGGDSIEDIAAEISQRLANIENAPQRLNITEEIASYFVPEETEWALTAKPAGMPMLKVNSGMMVNRSESETISSPRVRKAEFA